MPPKRGKRAAAAAAKTSATEQKDADGVDEAVLTTEQATVGSTSKETGADTARAKDGDNQHQPTKDATIPDSEIPDSEIPDISGKDQANKDAPSKPKPRARKKEERHRFIESGTRDAFDSLLEPFYYDKHLTDPIDTPRDKWNLLPAFLKVKGLVKQHIDSFNFFVEKELKNIVKANQWVRSEADENFWLKYTDIRIGMPTTQEDDTLGYHQRDEDRHQVTPNECRLRDMTYAAPIYVDYRYIRGNKIVSRKNTQIGRLPIMLKSSRCILTKKTDSELAKLNECSIDPGGYFIVKGQEKVILVQEQLSKNRVIVEAQKGLVQASVTSSTHERKSKSYVLVKKGKIYLKNNTFAEDIPIVVVFKAMGLQSDAEIMLLTAGEDKVFQDEFAINFEDPPKLDVFTQQQALEYIGSRIIRKAPGYGAGYKQQRNLNHEALEALASIILPHVPTEKLDFRQKAMYIAYMTRRVLMAMHDDTLVDDRDYVGNKRLELAGQLLSLLFEDNFKRFNTDFKATIDRVLRKPNRTGPFDAHEHIRLNSGHITASIERAIASGNWNLKRFRMDRAGITHVLSRLSYISALGMMTRITSQFEKTRKITGPRALQPSQFGMLCPSDTPEGESCGLVKNLALMTHITTNDDERLAKRLVFMLGAEDVTEATGSEIYADGVHVIFVNGTPCAFTRQPTAFINGFRRFRRAGRISEFVSIHVNSHYAAVHIATDEGRICRPLIIVENGKSKVGARELRALRSGKMDFDDFLTGGLVEYLDVNEENDAFIAIYESDIGPTTTHLEIEPFTILGAVAGLIPYPHHNQSPRNTYQCAMGKQAIGTIGYNQLNRLDALLYLMVYPQKPLVKTRTIELVKYDKLPAGQNAVVAVMSYSGYDIEDALVLNKASCDRGFGRCQVYKKVAVQLKKYSGGGADEFGFPEATKQSHRNLDDDGVAFAGARLSQSDIYCIKSQPVNAGTNSNVGSESGNGGPIEWKDTELAYKLPDPCYVDTIALVENQAETTILKIKTRQTRRPEVGDKFSSRHGQKGVVGIIAEQEDLPFTDSGIVPDVIMNPHGFPSRMTVGKMLELVAGKAGIVRGNFEYGTAFGGSDVQAMGEALIQNGFSYSGKDYLNCGITGQALPSYVFFGPIYYQKLKHMVQDKMHARSTGPRAMLTRQPTEGRSKAGGLRLGEMERDCLIAYGASQLLLERLMLSSDRHECDVCEKCGMMGYQGWCQSCESSEGVMRMQIPYAAKLLVQELLSMNIKATFKLGKKF